jgi:hypothetical protein
MASLRGVGLIIVPRGVLDFSAPDPDNGRCRFRRYVPIVDLELRLIEVEAMGCDRSPSRSRILLLDRHAGSASRHCSEDQFPESEQLEFSVMMSPQVVAFPGGPACTAWAGKSIQRS